MALINCPECKKEISDKANSCPNCGCPINAEPKENICVINGVAYDLTDVLNLVLTHDEQREFGVPQAKLKEILRCPYNESVEFTEYIYSTKSIPKQYTLVDNEKIVKCPRCGSTAITAGQRGFSIVTGFIGSVNTVNRCAKCGYKWKP